MELSLYIKRYSFLVFEIETFLFEGRSSFGFNFTFIKLYKTYRERRRERERKKRETLGKYGFKVIRLNTMS